MRQTPFLTSVYLVPRTHPRSTCSSSVFPTPPRRRLLFPRLRRLQRHCSRARCGLAQSTRFIWPRRRAREEAEGAERGAGDKSRSARAFLDRLVSAGRVASAAAAMSVDLVLWLFSFASVMALIGLTAYQLICLSDLEFDYINPYDSSSRINAVVIIEYTLQGALCASFLLTLHWFPFLVMAPVTYYHVKLYMARKHLVDVTEIFRQLNGEKKYRMIKLGFYFCLFIITIYSLVMTAVMLFIDEDTNLVETRTI